MSRAPTRSSARHPTHSIPRRSSRPGRSCNASSGSPPERGACTNESPTGRFVGDETLIRSPVAPFVSEYVGVITELSRRSFLHLEPALEVGITDERPPGDTRITFLIMDLPRNSTKTWQQCARDSLSELRTLGAGPEPEAARFVQAALTVRNATWGRDSVSAYDGRVPFGTLARGGETMATPAAPFAVPTDTAWSAFWLEHSGSAQPSEVDFDTEMVIVGVVGRREEAGDSVEIRQLLQFVDGTLTHVVEQVPGDCCSPVAQSGLGPL